MKYVRSFSMLMLLFSCLVKASNEPRVSDLIKVSLAGTQIEVFPNRIEIIVSDPHKAMLETQEATSRMLECFLSTPGTVYSYQKPEQWAERNGFGFIPRVGDTVYTFYLDSATDIDEFAQEYKLVEYASEKDGEGDTNRLYVANPGFYVQLLVVETRFSCPMHPRILSKNSGTCPVCGMDLIQIKVTSQTASE